MSQLIILGIILLGFLILAAYFKTNKGKGKIGELVVSFLLKFSLSKEYTIINNVTLEIDDGTTQIDHIIVSKYGVFSIETKNMAGFIYGKETDKTWTQKFFKKSFKFQNPLLQNYKHTASLKEILNINNVNSIIIFTGRATLKNNIKNVIYPLQSLKLIKSYTNIILSDNEIDRILKLLKTKMLKKCSKTDKQHVNFLKNKFKIK